MRFRVQIKIIAVFVVSTSKLKFVSDEHLFRCDYVYSGRNCDLFWTLLLPFFMGNTQAAGSSEMFLNLYQTVRCHIPDNSVHFREKLKTHKIVSVQRLLRNGVAVSFSLNSAVESQL
jgi:hypothetical protein